MTETKSPTLERFRVVGVGAIYQKPTDVVTPDGKRQRVFIPTTALGGEVIDLPDFEAERLLALGAVKDADEPLSYDEQSHEELAAQAAELGLEVRGTAADGSVQREDLINALVMHDRAAAAVDPAAAKRAGRSTSNPKEES